MAAEARAGTLQPKDYTDVNHSFSFAAGAVISTAADLATWMKALSGGKVFNAEYQRIWQDSAKIINPTNSYNWYGYGIDQLRWGKHVIDLHGGADPRLQLRGTPRPGHRHDPRHLEQPHHVARQQVHGRGSHAEGAGPGLRGVTGARHAVDHRDPEPAPPLNRKGQKMQSDGERGPGGPTRGWRLDRARRRAAVVTTATIMALIGAACAGPAAPSAPGTSASAPTTAPALKTIDQAALQALVDQTAEELLVPGCLVLLRTPQGEFVAASGTTKLGENSLPAVDTHFRIASITKTMTSAATLLLAQEGKLSLDDPVTKYIPGVPNGDNITIAQLLEMRSGLYSFTELTRDHHEHGRRPDQGLEAPAAAGHRVRPAAQLRARRRVRVQQHQLRAARPHRREAGRASRSPRSSRSGSSNPSA